jgi:hypothetical protein
VDLDGGAVIVDLKGRFWHDRRMVLARVEKFIQNRIPEVPYVLPWTFVCCITQYQHLTTVPQYNLNYSNHNQCFEVRVRDPRQLEAGNDDKESVEQFYRH